MKFSLKFTEDDFKDDGMGPPTKLIVVPMVLVALVAIAGVVLTLLFN